MDYIVGMDGGGSSTAVQGMTLEGDGLFRENFGPMNLNSNELSVVEKTVDDVFRFLKEQPGGLSGCKVLCLGSAGISNPASRETIQQLFETRAKGIPFVLVDDAEIALYGALGQPAGCIVIAGTGSIAMGQNSKGETVRTGGWGYLVDDVGSGYFIGREILTAVFRSYDYRGPITALTPMVWEELGLSTIPELVAYLYAPERQRSDIGNLAPLLDKALQQEDKIATLIRDQAITDLTQLATVTVERLGIEEEKISFLGGILQKSQGIRTGVLEELEKKYPKLVYTDPVEDAAWGACFLGRDYLSKEAK